MGAYGWAALIAAGYLVVLVAAWWFFKGRHK